MLWLLVCGNSPECADDSIQMPGSPQQGSACTAAAAAACLFVWQLYVAILQVNVAQVRVLCAGRKQNGAGREVLAVQT